MRKIFLLCLALLLLPSSPLGAQVAPTTLVTAVSAANAAVTATLPAAGAGLFHHIIAIQVTRTCTTAIVGSAVLTVTTTNLPGSPAFTMGNACLVGSTNRDVDVRLTSGSLKSLVANTASTVVCPALGATGICRITIFYQIAQ